VTDTGVISLPNGAKPVLEPATCEAQVCCLANSATEGQKVTKIVIIITIIIIIDLSLNIKLIHM